MGECKEYKNDDLPRRGEKRLSYEAMATKYDEWER